MQFQSKFSDRRERHLPGLKTENDSRRLVLSKTMLLAFHVTQLLLWPDIYATMATYYDFVLTRIRKEVSCIHARSYWVRMRQSARAGRTLRWNKSAHATRLTGQQRPRFSRDSF